MWKFLWQLNEMSKCKILTLLTHFLELLTKEQPLQKYILTLVAQTKQVVTTLEMTPMRFLVSWITLSTLEKVAALPTVGFLTLNCSCCTYVGTWSRCSRSSFLWDPMGTCQHRQRVSNGHSHYLAWPRYSEYLEFS